MALDEKDLAHLLEVQDGVVARRQVIACGGGPHDIRRMLRKGQWVVVHPGVCLNHTGEPTWRQRAWAAVLYAGPGAALDRESAIRADAGPGWRGCDESAPIRVAIDQRRTVKQVPGLTIRRVANLADKMRPTASPPRLRVEEATLEMALAARDDHATFEALAAPVRSRTTTADRLLEALAGRAKVPRREWLSALLHDLRDGSTSVLEQAYLTKVERAHGLPEARRQVHERRRGASLYRDVDYDPYDVLVELDGRDHAAPDRRGSDLDRDLDAAAEGRLTLRLGWRQVTREPCATAARLARVLRQRGWTGRPVPCGPGCVVLSSVA